jgi:hypothetical protein
VSRVSSATSSSVSIWNGGTFERERIDDHFDLSGRPLLVHVHVVARDDLAVHRDRELGTDLDGVLQLGAEHDLRQTVAIAQVDEVDAAVVAARVHPAVERDARSDVGLAEFAARVRAPPIELLFVRGRHGHESWVPSVER